MRASSSQFAYLMCTENDVTAGAWRNPENLAFALLELEPLLGSSNEHARDDGVRQLSRLYAKVRSEYRAHFGDFDSQAALPPARTIAAAYLPRYMKTLHVAMVRQGLCVG